MADSGYVNFYEILELDEGANPGEVRKAYRRKMKDLVQEIARAEITEERRARYLLEMAKLNVALYTLRDAHTREQYWAERAALIELETEWRENSGDQEKTDQLRRSFDAKVKHFLGKYVEEGMLQAGRDKECVEASRWDAAHERHASKILRQYRHLLYNAILTRLPYHQVTAPEIDWSERSAFADGVLAASRA